MAYIISIFVLKFSKKTNVTYKLGCFLVILVNYVVDIDTIVLN